MSGKSVVVVGGGIIGLCGAWYLAQSGHTVTVVERNRPDHDGCSLGNAGMIVPSHFVPLAAPGMVGLGLRMLWQPESPFAIRPGWSPDLFDWAIRFYRAANEGHVTRSAPLLRDLNLTSRRLYEMLADEFGNNFGLEKRGLLMLCKTAEGLREEEKLAARAHNLHVAAEILTPEEVARLDPDITTDIAGAVYFPNDCHLDPRRLMHALTQQLLRHEQVCFRHDTEITGWQTNNHGQIVAARTSEGRIAADEFVLAAGAWSGQIARRDLHLRLPLQAGKGYSITLNAPRELPRICAILTEARVAVTPMNGALRFAGTFELGGLDTAINPARVRGIIRAIPRYFPGFSESDFAGQPVWSGLRPCAPDGLPTIGRSCRWKNLTVATGHAMMGISLGPVTGQLIADLIGDNSPALDISPLSPDRFCGIVWLRR